MNSIFFKLAALVFALGTLAAHSQTLNWGSLTGSDIVDSRGGTLDNSFVFQLGSFEVGFIPTVTNRQSWSSHWQIFETASYSYDSSGGGYFTGTKNVQDASSYSSLFEGMTAYLWIYNSAGTEHFLGTSTAKSGIAEWKFPILNNTCCPNGEVTTWSVSNLGTDVPIWGSQGTQDGGGDFVAPGPFDIQTHAVPEPQSAALIAIFGFGLTMCRSRRVKN